MYLSTATPAQRIVIMDAIAPRISKTIIIAAPSFLYFLFGDMNVPIVWFAIGCIAESYIYSYLLERTDNNLISAMLYHFAWNLFVHLFAINPIDNDGNKLPYALLAIIEVVIAFAVSVIVKKKEKTN